MIMQPISAHGATIGSCQVWPDSTNATKKWIEGTYPLPQRMPCWSGSRSQRTCRGTTLPACSQRIADGSDERPMGLTRGTNRFDPSGLSRSTCKETARRSPSQPTTPKRRRRYRADRFRAGTPTGRRDARFPVRHTASIAADPFALDSEMPLLPRPSVIV